MGTPKIKMTNVESVDFSEWGFDISFCSSTCPVTSFGLAIFQAVTFTPVFNSELSRPLDISIVMPMDDLTYEPTAPSIGFNLSDVITERIEDSLDFHDCNDGTFERGATGDSYSLDGLISLEAELLYLARKATEAKNKFIKGLR